MHACCLGYPSPSLPVAYTIVVPWIPLKYVKMARWISFLYFLHKAKCFTRQAWLIVTELHLDSQEVRFLRVSLFVLIPWLSWMGKSAKEIQILGHKVLLNKASKSHKLIQKVLWLLHSGHLRIKCRNHKYMCVYCHIVNKGPTNSEMCNQV